MKIDGRYEVERELGAGAMGIVYLTTDSGLRRKTAVKVIAPELSSSEVMVDGFRREAAALAAVRNDHVAQVYAFGPHDGSYYFAMEYVEGRPLSQIIDEHVQHDSFVPAFRSITIVRQLAQGLDAIHRAGIVHRDLKPSNVLIEEGSGRPVLIDFGLAIHRLSDGSTTRLEGGTPAYMAPEQIQEGSRIVSHADQYSLGCTAFELFANRPPFLRATKAELLVAHLADPPPKLSSIRPDLQVFDPILARALAKNPMDRYPSAAEFARAFEGAAERWGAPDPTVRSGTVKHESEDALDILVVDDDPMFRKIAARAVQVALFDRSSRVRTASGGAEAIAKAQESCPDLLLLDFDMPGLNGLDVLARLREQPGGMRMRVLVVSARTGVEERWRFSVLGVRDFLLKPVELPVLVDTITAIAKRSGWDAPSSDRTNHDA